MVRVFLNILLIRKWKSFVMSLNNDYSKLFNINILFIFCCFNLKINALFNFYDY